MEMGEIKSSMREREREGQTDRQRGGPYDDEVST